jgi:thiosulfate/3-mercaptopyruvate sulfurtransferase
MLVYKDYIAHKLGKSILLDTREADSYFGIESDFLSAGNGHIPTSKLLPAPWIWTKAEDQSKEVSWLSWRDARQVAEMASAILGGNKEKEIIVYCGAGGFASPVFFILSEQLGYMNVKFYDGSMQDWTADPDAPVVKYRYE